MLLRESCSLKPDSIHKGHQIETKHNNEQNKKKILVFHLTDYAKSYKIGCALRGTSHAA